MGIAAIFVMWPRPHSNVYIVSSNGYFILNLSSIGFVASEKNMFKYTDGSPTWAILAERSMVNLDFRHLD